MKWQPIETAPKEGRVLIFSPAYKQHPEMYVRIVDAQFVKIAREATHWAPIPELPDASETEGEMKKPHKVMSQGEYEELDLQDWHEVCRNYDGFGSVAVRYLGVDGLEVDASETQDERRVE
jgi:hypothetical protein